MRLGPALGKCKLFCTDVNCKQKWISNCFIIYRSCKPRHVMRRSQESVALGLDALSVGGWFPTVCKAMSPSSRTV
jgi:hypothetical protein